MTTHRLTVYSVSDRGVLPQFYHDARTEKEADDWRESFLDDCAKAGVFVRIDRDPPPQVASVLIRIDRDPKHGDADK